MDGADMRSMATGEFRIFISAVTSEFRKARDALASDLRSRDTLVRVQSDFRQEAGSDTTLKKLHDYICDCSAVVCVIGTRSGACPPPGEAAPFLEMLPPGISEASYTQWEIFFARHYKRRLSIYIANPDYTPDEPMPTGEDRPDLQQALTRHIVEEQGLDRSYFSNVDQLARAVLKEDWPRKLAGKPILLPYASLGNLFKGRAGFMHKLHENLARNSGGRAAIVSRALYGLGGIGKTRAAVEYAWAYRDDYSALLFIIADSPEALRRNLAALTGPLGLPQRDAIEEAVRVQVVIEWLKANPGWLTILDNVDTNEALAEVEKLVGQLTGGKVLLTSRLANFPGDVEPLEIDLLPVEAAADFLLDRTVVRRRVAADDQLKARELAEELGCLALALEHAGAYIIRHRASFDQYHDLWRHNRDSVISWSDPAVTHYPRAVVVTWQTSVAQLTDHAKELLEILAWFSPEPLPESLLEAAGAGAEAQLGEAVADLAAYSLVTRDAQGPRFSVHRLVQDVTRRGLDVDTSRRRLVAALRWIDTAFAGNPEDPRNWHRLDPIVSHALAVAGYAQSSGVAEPTARLLSDLGRLHRTKALHAEAESLLRRGLVITEESLGPNHPNTAILLMNLAGSLQDVNRLTEAERLYRRALAITEKSFGQDHPMMATALSNLGHLLQANNRLAEAEPLARRALAIAEKNFGPDHPELAICLNNLGHLLRQTNRLAAAEVMMRRALAIDQKHLGPDHPMVAIRLNNLSLLLKDAGRFDEAEPMMRRALAIEEKAFGEDHPNIAIDLSNLGELLRATDRLEEAEQVARRALAIDESRLGPDHPNVAIRLNNLGLISHATNRPKEAEELIRRALAVDEKSLGPDDPMVAIRLNNLAELLRATKRPAKAEPLLHRALAIFTEFERKTGYRHPHFDAAAGNYVALLEEIRKRRRRAARKPI
jgi:tetratricopeptide (TPR) repeat protein